MDLVWGRTGRDPLYPLTCPRDCWEAGLTALLLSQKGTSPTLPVAQLTCGGSGGMGRRGLGDCLGAGAGRDIAFCLCLDPLVMTGAFFPMPVTLVNLPAIGSERTTARTATPRHFLIPFPTPCSGLSLLTIGSGGRAYIIETELQQRQAGPFFCCPAVPTLITLSVRQGPPHHSLTGCLRLPGQRQRLLLAGRDRLHACSFISDRRKGLLCLVVRQTSLFRPMCLPDRDMWADWLFPGWAGWEGHPVAGTAPIHSAQGL